MQSILIRGGTVHTEERAIKHAGLFIKNGKIAEIFGDEVTAIEPSIVIDATNLHVIPGFIDGHIHGAKGCDVMDATEEALDTMAAVLPSEGVTSFLATTMTQSIENIEKALINAGKYVSKPYQAEMIGIHLEGPFINKLKAGAQSTEYIQEPNIELFNKWQELCHNKIKTITMAPELDRNGEFIYHLARAGMNISAGHTNASFQQMKTAVKFGVLQLTHLCNAMNGIHHRDIGAVGAAFQLTPLRSELIADGIHVVDEMLQMTYDNVGSDRIILITDSMRAKNLGPGIYDLGGQVVKVNKDRAVLQDGTLAGSILNMQDAAKRMLHLDGVMLQDIIKMTATNIAKQLRIDDKKGSIAVEKDADILVVDSNLNIKLTICRGQIAYREKEMEGS